MSVNASTAHSYVGAAFDTHSRRKQKFALSLGVTALLTVPVLVATFHLRSEPANTGQAASAQAAGQAPAAGGVVTSPEAAGPDPSEALDEARAQAGLPRSIDLQVPNGLVALGPLTLAYQTFSRSDVDSPALDRSDVGMEIPADVVGAAPSLMELGPSAVQLYLPDDAVEDAYRGELDVGSADQLLKLTVSTQLDQTVRDLLLDPRRSTPIVLGSDGTFISAVERGGLIVIGEARGLSADALVAALETVEARYE